MASAASAERPQRRPATTPALARDPAPEALSPSISTEGRDPRKGTRHRHDGAGLLDSPTCLRLACKPMDVESADASPPASSGSGLRGCLAITVGLPLGFCLLAGIALTIQGRMEAAEREELAAAEQRLADSEVAAARALPNPCDGAARLNRFISLHDSYLVEGELASLLDACCARRIEELHGTLERMNAGAPVGPRSAAIVSVGEPLERAEEEMPTLERCGEGVLDQILSGALIERAHEDGSAQAWRGYARLLEADELGSERVAALLFPPARRAELARACIEGGLRAAPSGDDPEAALRAWNDLNACAVRAPPDTTVSAAELARIERGLSGAQRRVDALRAREARASERERAAERRRATHTARTCIRSCMLTGADTWDCAGRCAREHPDVAAMGMEY